MAAGGIVDDRMALRLVVNRRAFLKAPDVCMRVAVLHIAWYKSLELRMSCVIAHVCCFRDRSTIVELDIGWFPVHAGTGADARPVDESWGCAQPVIDLKVPDQVMLSRIAGEFKVWLSSSLPLVSPAGTSARKPAMLACQSRRRLMVTFP